MSNILDRRTLIFQNLGLTRIEARILHTLLAGSPLPLNARDIERRADIRQPEVSLGVKLLLARGWIQQKRHFGIGAGRPPNTYVLISNPGQIYIDLYREYSEKADFQKANLRELKDLLDVE